VVVEGVDVGGDPDGDGVPAQLVGVRVVQVVRRVGTVTGRPFDDVLLGVADHHGKIAVLLDAFLRDGLDSAGSPLVVDVEDAVDYPGGELPCLGQVRLPLLDCTHGSTLYSGPADKT
jgi:hypothetical protein